jgi:hypothetical protein
MTRAYLSALGTPAACSIVPIADHHLPGAKLLKHRSGLPCVHCPAAWPEFSSPDSHPDQAASKT